MNKPHASHSAVRTARLLAAVLGLALMAGCQTVDTEEDGSQGKDGATAGSGGKG